jgi:hypothetical protein
MNPIESHIEGSFKELSSELQNFEEIARGILPRPMESAASRRTIEVPRRVGSVESIHELGSCLRGQANLDRNIVVLAQDHDVTYRNRPRFPFRDCGHRVYV